MKVVILAGGLGTRLQEETVSRPKPMVEIGGAPILWHIMKIFASQGFDEFVIPLGYRGDMIKSYFINYFETQADLSIDLSTGHVQCDQGNKEPWTVHLIDTGLNTQTGGRLKRIESRLKGEPFLMTYGDGVADIDLARLSAFHRQHQRLATVTAVHPPARFGSLQIDGDVVASFTEKSQVSEGWINGGFFVLEPGVMQYIDGDTSVFEQVPLERLAADGQLAAYRHETFWQCMDTLRDRVLLERLWQSGTAPWHKW